MADSVCRVRAARLRILFDARWRPGLCHRALDHGARFRAGFALIELLLRPGGGACRVWARPQSPGHWLDAGDRRTDHGCARDRLRNGAAPPDRRQALVASQRFSSVPPTTQVSSAVATNVT